MAERCERGFLSIWNGQLKSTVSWANKLAYFYIYERAPATTLRKRKDDVRAERRNCYVSLSVILTSFVRVLCTRKCTLFLDFFFFIFIYIDASFFAIVLNNSHVRFYFKRTIIYFTLVFIRRGAISLH